MTLHRAGEYLILIFYVNDLLMRRDLLTNDHGQVYHMSQHSVISKRLTLSALEHIGILAYSLF